MTHDKHARSGRGMVAIGGVLAAALLAIGLMACLPQLQFGPWPNPSDPNTTLADVERAVTRNIPVPEITAAALRSSAGSTGADDLVLFDVREPAEYSQSHIAGAQRIDPSMSAADFLSRFGSAVRGKTVVFYCAVGVRSGYMLERVRSGLEQRGIARAYNLRGGIFRWFASAAPVVNDSGPARNVHPYDEAWGKLLQRTVASMPDGRT